MPNRDPTYIPSRTRLCFVLLVSLLWQSLPAAAQVQKGGRTASAKAAAAAPKCSGAWTGTITYTRQQKEKNHKRVERVSARGVDSITSEANYDYSAQIAVIESPEKNGSSIGRATVDHNMTATEKVETVEKNSCDRGKTWQEMTGSSVSRSETTGSQGGLEANVYVGVNEDGTYTVSAGIPQIKGKVGGSSSTTFSGQCTPKPGKSFALPPTETTLDGHSLTSDGTSRVDPGNPNKISGSYTLTLPGNVVETISWNLQKCGGPLRITDLKFEDMKFPKWDDWKEIVEQTGTVDGNWVKIKAKVLNVSGESREAEVAFKETYKGDKWDGARPDMPIKDNSVYVRLDPGEERDVEVLWDTSGYAWFDDGRPRLVQRIKTELWEKNKLTDEMTKNVKVAPKPLVLVHGLWSSWKAWETWQNILTTSHSYDWKAFAVGERPEKGLMNTGGSFLSTQPTNSIAENARELESYIKYAQEDRNAWHVDIVAHSMGGLISRYYIAQIMPGNLPDGRPKVAHLVMLGTPNMGSPCADVMNVAFEATGYNVEAVRQLRQDYAEGFNRINVNRKGVRFSALAGNPLPTMCKSVVWNDGVVPVPSAKWKIADTAESKNIHTELTGTADFSAFVKPRLAMGPHGNFEPEAPDPRQYTGRSEAGMFRHYGARADVADILSVEPVSDTVFARSIKIGAKQSVEVNIAVAAASNLGVTFMADPMVSVTLIDGSGNVAGSSLAGSAGSRAWFRSIYYDKPTVAGTWKLRIENTGDFQYPVVLTTWTDAVK